MRRAFFSVPLLLLFATGPAFSDADGGPDFHFKGPFIQGGLVTGKAPPGSDLHFDGKPLRLSREGNFVIAFGRKAQERMQMTYRLPDGTSGALPLSIMQREYPVEKIEGLPAGKVTPSEADLARIRNENAALSKARRADTDAPLFITGFDWPVTGRVSGVYGSQRILNGKPRSPHSGTDIATAQGTPILAPADGIVAWRHPDMFFTGRTVLLDHGHGLFTVYAHLDRIDVAKGARVKKGDPIGTVGASGRATAPHLHWGISWFGTALDPEIVAGPMPKQP
ncbi:MAG: M23 family metallopeptidase [Alphaproteobacteria bacterium]|nr:M23 family metallopeptidase [Alphaproteobacteria bacterium]